MYTVRHTSFRTGFHFLIRRYSKQVSSVEHLREPVTETNQHFVLEDVITPLARTSYNEQLKIKRKLVEEFVKDLKRVKPISPEILPISPSPVTDYYRNKDEFNVGKGIDGDEKTFGFFTGRMDADEVFAVRPTHLRNVRQEHKEVLRVFEDFVKQSPLPPCYLLNDGGYWRRLLIRSNCKGDIMAVAVVHPQNRTPDEINDEKHRLVQHFIDNGINLSSLYHQLCTHVKCDRQNSTLSLIHGTPYIYENLLGYEFRISPDSFFQINVKAAEILHEEVLKLAEFNSSGTLLDLCCGVGTFSISYHQRVRNCVGIELAESSLNDALVNCSLNNVTNCEFTLGRVETRLSSVYDFLENSSDLVVIANPGRSGLHPRAITLLKENPLVNKLIYVSCKPTNVATMKNFITLLSKDKKTIKDFKLKVVKPIDMFPQTYHYELILLFER